MSTTADDPLLISIISGNNRNRSAQLLSLHPPLLISIISSSSINISRLFNSPLVSPAGMKSLHQRRRHRKRTWQNLIKTNKSGKRAVSTFVHRRDVVVQQTLVFWAAHFSTLLMTPPLSQCLCFSIFPCVIAFSFHIWNYALFAFKRF